MRPSQPLPERSLQPPASRGPVDRHFRMIGTFSFTRLRRFTKSWPLSIMSYMSMTFREYSTVTMKVSFDLPHMYQSRRTRSFDSGSVPTALAK